jgi:hypothetical protein
LGLSHNRSQNILFAKENVGIKHVKFAIFPVIVKTY